MAASLGGLMLAAWLAAAPPAGRPTVIYVSSAGNDAWSGRLATAAPDGRDGPLRTLAAARARVRQAKRKAPGQPVIVKLAAGVYELSHTLVLGPEDSGSSDAPVIWQAAKHGAAVLRGGRTIRGWKPWRGKIYRADLKAQGLGGIRFHQLFYKGRRQPLARHPNFDPTHPRTGGFLYVYDRAPNPRDGFIYAPGVIPFDRWRDISQAEVFSVYWHGWPVAITPIRAVDTKHRLISVRRVRLQFLPLNRYFIQNVLDALDAPGEWFLDYKTSQLYFWPPDGGPPGDNVVVPVLDNIIELRGSIPYPPGRRNSRLPGPRGRAVKEPTDVPDRPVHDIIIRGLTLEAARRDAVRLVGARRCSVLGCTVGNVGGVGINLGGVVPLYPEVGNPRDGQPQGLPGGVGGAGQDLYFQFPCQSCRVAGNDVYSTGSDGIFLYGRDNVAENNHVFDTSLLDKDSAGINLWGERCVARRNTIHDVPRNAVFLKGTAHVVELNDIRFTMLETCDGGAVRMCQRDVGLRGCIIRYNRIFDTVGYGYPRGSLAYRSPYFSWGVYLDDYTSGTTVRGNIIVRAGRGGVMIHGGSDNVVEGNIIAHAGRYLVEVQPIKPQDMSGNVIRSNVLAATAPGPVAYRLARLRPAQVHIEKNVVWAAGKPIGVDIAPPSRRFPDWRSWLAAGIDRGSICADPRFVAPQRDDWRLGRESPAWKLGFKKIPREQIGCYKSPERASWPVQTPKWLVREKPVLYHASPPPLHEDFELDRPGRRPRHGDVLAAPGAPIVVTGERAFSGRLSLKFTDAPGLRPAWMPRIFYPLAFTSGTVRLSAALWLHPKLRPRLVIDARQYSDVPDREYYSGPVLIFTEGGKLLGTGGKQLADLPFGQWFTVRVWMKLGAPGTRQAPGELQYRDGRRIEFAVPVAHRQFQRLDRLVISCPADKAAVFYVDDLFCEPVKAESAQH